MEHLDFVEAVERLAARAGITLRYDDQATGRDHQRRTRIHETLEQAVAWYHQRLLSAPDAAAARRYLRHERGYDGEVVRQYQLGWAPEGWDQLVRSLGVPPAALVDAGLATVDDPGATPTSSGAGCCFPSSKRAASPVGRRRAAAARRPRPQVQEHRGHRGLRQEPGPVRAQLGQEGRSSTRAGWSCARATPTSSACSGPACGEAVATCGTALADGHIRLLTNFARRIVLAYDADAAGQAAAERYYEWERRFEVDIRVAALPAGADPADLARAGPGGPGCGPWPRPGRTWASAWTACSARADLSTPEGRARAAAEAIGDGARASQRAGPGPVPDAGGRPLPGGAGPAAAAWRPRAASRPGPRAGRVRPVRVPARRRRVPARASAPSRRARRSRAGGVAPGRPPARRRSPTGWRGAVRPSAGPGRLRRSVGRHRPCTRPSRRPIRRPADLLQRLAVEDTDADVDEVMIRLVERAGQRALPELQAEMRQAEPEDQAGYRPTDRLAEDGLRDHACRADRRNGQPPLEAEQRLVGWIVARDEAERQTEATDE